MKNRYLRNFHVLVTLLCLIPPQVISAPKQWVVGVEDTRYFPHFDVSDGQWGGFGAAVLDQFAQSVGYELVYKPMPVERLFRSFVLGEVDFKYPAVEAWKPEIKSGVSITYSDPVVGYIDGLNLLQNRAGGRIEHIRTIGIVRGFSPVSWSDRVASGDVALIQGDSFLGLIRLVLLGRVDALYANTDAVAHSVLVNPDLVENRNIIVFDQSLPHDRGTYRLATRDHADVIREFNEWMADNSELMEKLKIEYFGVSQY